MFDVSESIIYKFEGFCLDARNHTLRREESNEAIHLPNKAIELLLLLVRNPGRTLSKDEILEAIWSDSIVEESNLSQTIFVLRKGLGDDTKKPRYILTIPGRGYQFIAEVTGGRFEDDAILDESFLSPGSDSASDRRSPPFPIKRLAAFAAAAVVFVSLSAGFYWYSRRTDVPIGLSGVRTLAILPFEDVSAEPGDRYLGIALADTLANRLGSLRQIAVRPTRTVLRYTETRDDPAKIGRELQVDAVLDGRIQRVGNRLRVGVQLVRTNDNAVIWTGSFDDEFTNLFDVQDSIGQQVVQALALQLDNRELQRFRRKGTESNEAYQEYLLGKFYWNKRTSEDLDRALNQFNRAIEIDPNFSLAYAGLAETHAIYPFYASVPDKTSLPKARLAATRALELDGELAEAFTVLAYVQSQYDFNWTEAERSYQRAIELNPNHATTRQWYGEFLAFHARYDESLTQMQRAVQLDPTSLSTNTAPALVYNASRQFEKTLETTEKVLRIDPTFIIARHYKARALYFSGHREEGIELHRQVVADSDGAMHFKADLGFMLAKAGDESAARRILAEMRDEKKQKHVSPYYFALIHIGLGEKDRAFEFLRQAVAEHDNNVIVMKVGVNFDDVRNDPQFSDILKSANF